MSVVATRNTSVDADLAQREARIEAGLRTFLEVGRDLTAIGAQRLYYQDYETFEDYCLGRWNFSNRRARQLMAAADSVDSLPVGTMVPTTERQGRELAGLDPEVAAEVMAKAHTDTGGKVTAAAISEAREQIAPKPPVSPPAAPEVEPANPRPEPAKPAPRKQTAEEAQEVSSREWSRNLASCVWLLATFGMHEGAAKNRLTDWRPAEDKHPEPTTPDRMRQAAAYLLELAADWEAQQ